MIPTNRAFIYPEWKRAGTYATRLSAVLLISALTAANQAVAAGSGEEGQGALGKWAIQLQIGKDFTVGGLQGSEVSLLRTMGARSAIRVGLGVNATTSRIQTAFRDTRFSNEQFAGFAGSVQTYQLAFDLLRLPPAHDGARFYWGGGPLGLWGRSHQEESRFANGDLDETIKSTGKAWGLGASSVLGVEWLPRENIGVVAEYRAALQYSESTVRQSAFFPAGQVTVDGTTRNKSWEFDLAKARLGLSLYF